MEQQRLSPIATSKEDVWSIGEAAAAARAAANAARVTVRNLSLLSEFDEVCALYNEIWRPEPQNPPVTTELLRAMVQAGNYVAGALSQGALVGACIGFFAPPRAATLHSHIAGVSGRAQARGVGFALKLHQRAWALEHSATAIEWTFDPLIRRNAFFNLTKLAAVSTQYLPNFYGRMGDQINAGDDSDRLLITWPLRATSVARACSGDLHEPKLAALLDAGAVIGLDRDRAGWPVEGTADGRTVLLAVPADAERLRSEDPACAQAWRRAVKQMLEPLLRAGGEVRGFVREGWYVVERQ
ncbi:hypothetical protein GCM10009789_12270 [Kribbella sancticallisti]|uniref:N-acetyltransferase domain-containing protein n=1 Tax=Kribbella sancticallisti TaxID=460087 RepID=A0ABP4NEF7_9ACTN